jgi:ABC-type transporter Mla subunit MlaD
VRLTDEIRDVRPRVRASLLWGVVGVLAFLVLVQGYELWTGYRYSLGVKFGVALGVGAGATVTSYLAAGRLFE